jgi:hypothetical protein
MHERRRKIRARVLKGAKLVFDTDSIMDCTVRNLSDFGATIDIPNTIDLPERLSLSIDKCHSFRRGRLTWRKLNKAGIEFF